MAEQLEQSTKEQNVRARTLMSGVIDPQRYEIDDSFRPANIENPWEVHTTAEMVACMERNPKIELDAKVLAHDGKASAIRTVDREKFLESWRDTGSGERMRESFENFDGTSMASSSVGHDFTPLIGGPFYKNLYFYQDYIRMHAQAFYAWNHDPIAKAIINITQDFTLGRGFRINCDDDKAMAYWNAFSEANDFENQVAMFARELSIYGESMIWKLPNMESRITYDLARGDKPPIGILPRVRVIDPSNIVEIITYPEDITRKLAFVWLQPTQYQMYTGLDPKSVASNNVQPTTKFIYRQIPAMQMLHSTVNCVSNEKRGRSDLYAVLGYLKRLRDIINYGVIGTQKQAAWALDTEIDGSQADVDAYIAAQQALGTIAPAGSEFVHTTKIKRMFQSNQLGRGSSLEICEWVISLICAGTNIPFNYLGTHISGGSTRASALVATEPVAKKFENRQEALKRTIRQVWDYVMQTGGLGKVDSEITFPEIITQDRSAKLKDLALAETMKWFSPKRSAEIAVKEFGVDNYDWDQEQKDIAAEPQAAPPQPMSAPGLSSPGSGAAQGVKASAVTGEEKKDVKDNYGF